jgi:hypothetical protein
MVNRLKRDFEERNLGVVEFSDMFGANQALQLKNLQLKLNRVIALENLMAIRGVEEPAAPVAEPKG